jgi:hypothetical protein
LSLYDIVLATYDDLKSETADGLLDAMKSPLRRVYFKLLVLDEGTRVDESRDKLSSEEERKRRKEDEERLRKRQLSLMLTASRCAASI